MPIYVTFREGPSPSTSIPIFVVSDSRLIDALVRELLLIARGSSTAKPGPHAQPVPFAHPRSAPRAGARHPDERESQTDD